MNYALNCTGAGHVQIPTKTTPAGALRLCRYDIELTSYTTAFLYGSSIADASNNNVRINSATQVAIQTTVGTTRTINMPAGSILLNTRLVIEVFRTTAPAFEVHVNGELKGSAAIGTSELNQLMPVSYIGAATNGTAKIRAKIYEVDLFGNTYLNVDAPNSPTWGDGELVGFPTDGTQWIEYTSGGGTAPTGTVTIGTITPNSTGASVPFTYSAADQTGFEYQLNETGTIYPISASPATPTGLTSSTAYTIRVRAKNASGDGAWSASAPFTTSAAGSPPSGTFTVGTITTAQTTASVPYTYSAADFDSIQYRINGGTPVTASASPQSLTGLTAGTTYGIEFRAVNAFGNGAWSTSAPFTTSAVPVGTITTGVLRRLVGGAPLVSTALTYFRLYNPTTGALVLNRTDLSTDANGRVTCTDAALTAGVEYKADWLAATGETRMSKKAAT